MITEFIFSFLFGIVELLINLIPTIELPSSFLVGMGDVAELISVISYVLPINTFLLCMSVVFILQNARFIVSIFNFIIRKIPGLS